MDVFHFGTKPLKYKKTTNERLLTLHITLNELEKKKSTVSVLPTAEDSLVSSGRKKTTKSNNSCSYGDDESKNH